jgi:glucuronokinase
MTTRHQAHARAGLLGNPSDGYGGACIALSVRNFAATVSCRGSDRVRFRPGPRDRREYADLDALVRAVDRVGYYGGTRLLMAAVRRFHRHCAAEGRELPDRGFELVYRTGIPEQVGLAGSSALITATFRCLMDHFDVGIDQETLPTLVLEAETEELGISAGLMDRVIQAWGGLVHMELGEELLAERGRGRYRRLEPDALPPLYLAWHPGLAEGSQVTHEDLRRRYDAGDPEVWETMTELADLTARGRELLEAGRGDEIGSLMDRNFDLRGRICAVGEGNRRLVETGRRLGAHPKFAGSGGAVVAAYDGDPERLERLGAAYAGMGARLVTPVV